MIDVTTDHVLSDNYTDTHGFKKTSNKTLVTWRRPDLRTCLRDVWVDHLGDTYVIEPGLTRFVRLDSYEVSTYSNDPELVLSWQAIGEGRLVRPKEDSDLRGYEMLTFLTPYDFSQTDEHDEYRAYLWDIDLDDFDSEHKLAVLDACGYVDVRAGMVNLRLANAIGCQRVLGEGTLGQLVDYIGPERLVSDIVDFYGSSWQIPMTFHEQDAGYNGPWSDSFDPDFLPWGSVTADELVFWMCSLGCVDYAPLRSLDSLLVDGFDGDAFVVEDKDLDITDRPAFLSLDAAMSFAEATKTEPEITKFTLSEGNVLEQAEATQDMSSGHGHRR
ncbi:MAG: hypothetical protein IJ092_06625 [Atopobiaceae bacterium]|nr:hypothetical protein [Atopobiaceae bacterium]